MTDKDILLEMLNRLKGADEIEVTPTQIVLSKSEIEFEFDEHGSLVYVFNETLMSNGAICNDY